jgi:hypothetical protein
MIARVFGVFDTARLGLDTSEPTGLSEKTYRIRVDP